MKAAVQKDARPSGEVTAQQRNFIAPEVNIVENRDGYVWQVEMPGVNKRGLEITLEGNKLTIVGHREDETLDAEVLLRESRQADYRRAFELDPAIDATKISARMEQGVLTLHLPKAERVKPRKITVTD